MKKTLIFLVSLFGCFSVSASIAGDSNFDLFFKSSNNYEDVIVQEVISIDTFIIENTLKKGEKIKLIGVKGPKIEKIFEKEERDQYGFTRKENIEPTTPIEEQAMTYLIEMLEGKHIRLELDDDKTDDDFNTLAYAYTMDDNTFINLEIIRLGYGHLQISPPNTKYAKELRKAYKEAREEKRGLQGE